MKGFFDKVYEKVMLIPEGKVATYGMIAAMCGNPRCSRAVGYALHVNPLPGIVPCHRVVNAAGRCAPGWAEQAILLRREHVVFRPNGNVDLDQCLWDCFEE